MIKDELLNQHSFPVITNQIEQLDTHYKIQAHPRLINLFYLADQLRERIERNGDKWVVLNTEISWTEQEMLEELEQHPERFSPNVMLRGLFQETILPNVAFIGGGAEVAYWLQLKTVFDHYHVFYPAILLRQSVLWINSIQSKVLTQLALTVPEIFKQETNLIRDYVVSHSSNDWQTETETAAIESIFQNIKNKATLLDPTLRSSAEASLIKMKHQLLILEKKMLRAEKNKLQTQLQRITRVKNTLFPNNGLQERVENFSEYYLEYGSSFFDDLMLGIKPLENLLLVIQHI